MMQSNKSLRFKKISWKLTIFYAAIFSVILLALSFGILYGMQYFLMQEAYRTLEGSTAITRENILDALAENHGLGNLELLSEAEANSNVDVAIADSAGKVVNQSGDTGISVTSDPGMIRQVQAGDNHLLVQNTQIIEDGKAAAWLQITLNLFAQDSFLRVAQIAIGFADIAGILLSLLAGNLAGRRMLKPIDNITKTAREISITDLNRRIESGDGDDELTRLANTFNDMIERLRIAFEKQNGFVSDASHELRTPIAVIRGYIDMIDRWGKNDPSILNESIAAIQNETHNMEDLVEKLLFLARSDSGRLNVAKETFDLRELVDEITTEYGLIHPKRLVRNEIAAGTALTADRRLVKQALRSLVDNGIKFSPEQGVITITSGENERDVSITVADQGIGIPPEKIGSIFERFYRVDRSRTGGGTGLGLSIAKHLVEAHAGSIWAESRESNGSTFYFTMPVYPM
ncbi:MAG: HAMP domain-containing sensor histidine kinase [Eubacteriales bacterium]